MKLKRWVSLMIAFCLMCTGLQVFTVNTYAAGASGEGDEEISCYCSFDMEIDSSFKDYPIYQYAENGIVHVSAYYSRSGIYFEFGTKDKFAVEAHKRIIGSSTWQKGEWMIMPAWTEGVKWDGLDFVDDDSDNAKLFMRNVKRFTPNNPLKAKNSLTHLAIDMTECPDEISIQMYLYKDDGWDADWSWDDKKAESISSIAEFVPSSFEEMPLTQHGKPRTRSLFRQKGGAWSGDGFSDISDNKEDDSKPPTEKEPQSEDKNKEDSELNSNPGNKENEQDKNSGNKDENKPSENIKPTEKGINQGENVPKSIYGLTKEESIDKYSVYYDENGVRQDCTFYKGIRGDFRYEAIPTSEISFSVPQNLTEVSSNGTTKFVIYDAQQNVYIKQTGELRTNRYSITILKASGNLGTKYYELGNTAWRIPKGSTVSNFPGLDENTSYYGWQEVSEITDEYIAVGGNNEAGSIKIHFADSARTGIESLEFDFDGMHTKMFYDEIDYIGPFFTFFMGYGLDDEWLEAAKRLGLTAKTQEEK